MESPASPAILVYKPELWGVIISSMFYGMTLLQAFYYYSHTNDGWIMKSLIAILLMLESADILALVLGLQRLLITNWGNPEIFTISLNEFTASILTTTLIVMIVQLSFAVQIQRFSRRVWPLTYFMMLCTITAAAIAISFCIHTFIGETDSRVQPVWKNFGFIPSIIEAAVDLASSTLLIILLNGTRGSYSIRSTQNIVKRIVLFTMTRGVLLTVVQIIYTVIYIAAPATGVWNAFLVIVARLYTNNLLAMLNFRESMKTRDNIVTTSGTTNAHWSARAMHQSGGDSSASRTKTSIADSFAVGAPGRNPRTQGNKHEEFISLEAFE